MIFEKNEKILFPLTNRKTKIYIHPPKRVLKNIYKKDKQNRPK